MGRLLGRKILEKEQESQKDTMALEIPWLELHASTIGRTGFIPGWGTKSSHVMWQRQRKKKKKRQNGSLSSSE